MPCVNPVKFDTKVPVPLPSLVLLSEMVGFALTLQQTPRAVTTSPPSEDITPPEVAVVYVIVVTEDVVNSETKVGIVANTTSFP